MRFQKLFPHFSGEVVRSLDHAGLGYLARQMERAEIRGWRYVEKKGSVYIIQGRERGRRESGVWKDVGGWVGVDVDKYDEVVGVEAFERADLHGTLQRFLPLN